MKYTVYVKVIRTYEEIIEADSIERSQTHYENHVRRG